MRRLHLGEPNRLAPGNVYTPNTFSTCAGDAALEWHTSEQSHSWMAARRAGISILINPGETRLRVEAESRNPYPYLAEIWLDEKQLGTMNFNTPGVQFKEFPLPANPIGPARLSFRVPHLWRPAQLIRGSDDERLVGLAVHSATLG